jgi:NAD(P)-dependent dehydrogenase (short-subunit alcohol dehydrogenase family)
VSRNIFITGGTTGIGLELAKLYLKQGDRVAICGRDLSKLNFSHPQLQAYELDVKDREKLIAQVEEFSQNRLDIFIANAGRAIADKSALPDFSLAKDVIDVNVGGVLNSLEAALKIMLPLNGGQFVIIASVAGLQGLPGAAAYCASKAAVLKLGESYALDLKKYNISVTTIAPGFIDTPLTRKNSHTMPWLMSAEKGAMKIFQAIEKQRVLYIFPWPMMIVTGILSRLPRLWYRWLMQLPLLNYNKHN